MGHYYSNTAVTKTGKHMYFDNRLNEENLFEAETLIHLILTKISGIILRIIDIFSTRAAPILPAKIGG